MTTRSITCLLLVLLLLIGMGALGAAPGDISTGPGAAEKKLQERIEVLAEVVQVQTKAYESKKASLMDVVSAQQELLQAKLELITVAEKRIELLDEQVKLAKQWEEVLVQLVQVGEASKADLLKLKAERLKAEADLADAQWRLKSPQK